MSAVRYFVLIFTPVLLLLAASSAAAESPEFRFGILTDIQYADQESAGSLYYRASPAKLEEAVDDFNGQDLAFVLQLGDMIDADFASFDTVLPILSGLNAPLYHVLGNHDYDVEAPLKSEVAGKLGLRESYYDFQHGSWRFVILNGNEISFHAGLPESEGWRVAKERVKLLRDSGRKNGSAFNGALGQAQLEWLDEKLSGACSAQEKVVVAAHFPVYPPQRDNLWDDRELVELLERHACVFAYFSGHHHAGGYGVKDKIHYVNFHGMVETSDTNAYAVAEVYRDSIRLNGKGREPRRHLTRDPADFIDAAPKKDAASAATVQPQPAEPFQRVPVRESRAYQKYARGSRSELAKLIYLLDRFKMMKVMIIYDGMEYDTDFSIRTARRYLQRKYRGEDAVKWLRMHTYRSLHSGEVIRIKFPDGKKSLLRDELFGELEKLKQE